MLRTRLARQGLEGYDWHMEDTVYHVNEGSLQLLIVLSAGKYIRFEPSAASLPGTPEGFTLGGPIPVTGCSGSWVFLMLPG